jgi:hypothetical protein
MADTSRAVEARLNTVDNVIERLNLGRSTVFELLSAELAEPGTGLRSVKVGRRRLVPEQALIDFIAGLEAAAATGVVDDEKPIPARA